MGVVLSRVPSWRGAATLPNVLTGARLAMVPVLAVVLAGWGDSPQGRWLALVLFLLASATDVLDGHLARRWGSCTPLGALLDPVADKALVGTALVALAARGLVPWWATVVVLGRELAVTLLRLAVVRRGVIAAGLGGKAKTVVQTGLVVLALLVPHLRGLLSAVVAVVVAVTVASGLGYAVQAWRLVAAGGRAR